MTVETISTPELSLGYRQLGSGPAVLLLHGWPTSSFLWRRVMPPIAERNCRAVALDLPGFGASDKPLGIRYSFEFFERTLENFLDALDIGRVALGGHDLGGPIAVHWALRNPDRVTSIALLNTLLYPQFCEAVVDFVQTLLTPGRREQLTSPEGLLEIIRLGLAGGREPSPETLAGVLAPFHTDGARRALADAGVGLGRAGFVDIERGLSSLRIPMRVIYGVRDRVLPDLSETIARLHRDVPQANITALQDCGHFLQEENPALVGSLLADFYASKTIEGA